MGLASPWPDRYIWPGGSPAEQSDARLLIPVANGADRRDDGRVCGRVRGRADAAEKGRGFQTSAPYAILIDADTGTVLFEKSADELDPPASMSKLMTVEVVFNAIAEGRIKLDRRIHRSARTPGARAARRPAARAMFAPINSRVKVEDLLRGVIIAVRQRCLHRARRRARRQRRRLRRHDEHARARELGLTQVDFTNATGLPRPEPADDGARARQARAAHHRRPIRSSTRSTPSASSPGTRSASRTAIRCSPWASAPTA